MRRLAAVVRLVAVLTLSITAASAHGTQEAAPAESDEPLESPDQVVDVEAPAPDESIEARLTRILEATGRFTSIRVRVRDGVATLEGVTSREEHRDWAGDLARRTQDVAAVINNISVDQGSFWTLEPARRELVSLWREIVQSLPLVVVGAIVLAITLLLAGALSRILTHPVRRATDSELLRSALRKTAYVGVVILGVYLFLRISGLTRIAVAVVSGTGLIGLILGFAFRDIAENFLASILISMQKPFRLGDVIEVEGATGVVQKVTTRGTILIDFDGNHIQISNATVYKNAIKNFTANPKMRISFGVGIGYDASINRAQEIAMDVLERHSAVLADPEPSVLVEKLGAATINLRVYFWINGHETSMLKVKSSVMRLVVRAFEKGGISLPDESREVIFPQGVPVTMQEADRAPAPPARPRNERDAEQESTEAEGDLASEVDQIERQARESRAPEEGRDILS